MKTEVIYELKQPFEYSYKGEMREAEFITLLAPTFRNIDNVTPMKQAFMRSITEISEKVDSSSAEESNEDKTISGQEVMQVMYSGSGDMVPVMLHAEQLFTRGGAALIDGETKMTKPLMEKVSTYDFESMVGEYVANFIAASILNASNTS